jgi:hypothetical protein
MATPQTSGQYFDSNRRNSSDKQWVEREEGLRDLSEIRFRYSQDFKVTAMKVLLSGTFAIDSTGVKTITTAHGLNLAPDIQDVQLTISENTNVDDFAVGYVKVESVDSTNVVAKVNVTTASGTAAATAKLNILIIMGA